MSPLRAYRDLRLFLGQPHPHQLLFGFLAIAVTRLIVAGFFHASHIPPPYNRTIINVAQSPPDPRHAALLAPHQTHITLIATRLPHRCAPPQSPHPTPHPHTHP